MTTQDYIDRVHEQAVGALPVFEAPYGCRLCGGTWNPGTEEQHNDGCMADPANAAQVEGVGGERQDLPPLSSPEPEPTGPQLPPINPFPLPGGGSGEIQG